MDTPKALIAEKHHLIINYTNNKPNVAEIGVDGDRLSHLRS